MEKIEIHFFHGFLGEPSDWTGVAELIPKSEPVEMHFHSLIEIFQSLKNDRTLTTAAKKVESQLEKSNSTKLLVGYSLGGRVIMHLKPKVYSKMLLLGAHPGLDANFVERLQRDEDWANKAVISFDKSELSNYSSKKMRSPEKYSQDKWPRDKWPRDKWIEEWNHQPIFANDQIRPQRKLPKETFATYLQILVDWSLGKQKNLRQNLFSNAKNIFWVCGEKDEKFCVLGKQLKQVLPQGQVLMVPDAGHGVLFDQPQYVAQLIEKIMSHVR